MAIRLIHIISAFLLTTAFAGCDFDQPIAKSPDSKIDSRLLGRWVHTFDDETITVALTKKDDSHFAGQTWEVSEPDDITNFTAWPSLIGNEMFLTVDLGEKESKRYIYLRIKFLNDNKIEYRQVNSDSKFAKDKFGDPSPRLARHINDEDLLGETKVFLKPL